MAQVNLVDKKVAMELGEIIKFQLLTHAYIRSISLSDLDLECLTSLGIVGEVELTEFCTAMAEKRLKEKLKTWKPASAKSKKPEASPQTIRNVLIKVERAGLISKTGKGRKKIELHPDLKVQTSGNILLNYKFYCVEPERSE